MTTDLHAPPSGPDPADLLDDDWAAVLAPLLRTAPGGVSVDRGWNLDRERERWAESAAAGREHLSVRVYDDEVVIGPRWVPGTDSGCACCAEVRERSVREHPLVDALDVPCTRTGAGLPMLPELVAAAVANLADVPLRPGEVYVVGERSVRRRRVARSFYCPVCAPRESPDLDWRPEPLVLRNRPSAPHDPTRDAENRLTVRHRLRDRLVDDRYGPVRAIMREVTSPFAMTMAYLPEAPSMGYGRAVTFGDAEPVAIIEGYERLAGFPFSAPVLMNLAYADIAGFAVDPATLGQHTEEQLAHVTSRVLPVTPTTPLDWVWGHDLDRDEPVLVPAEVGFFQYEYRHRLARRAARAARAADPRENRKFFYESSSGCAAGSTVEEAALHSLLELAERDAFLLSWHRAKPLPVIADASITDPDSRALIALIRSRGFDVHVMVAKQDIDLPIVWAMAVNRRGTYPASFSSGGSGIDPASAVRGALREVAQLVTDPLEPDTSDIEPMLADPWLLEELAQHPRLYTLPETLPRATAVLGGPEMTVAEAFPGWPHALHEAARGDVRGAYEHIRDLFAAAGLDRVVLVDQSSREHVDAGIAVVKAVVPGIVPMCFGHAQQRLKNLPRLTAALAGTPTEHRAIPYDPHPFP